MRALIKGGWVVPLVVVLAVAGPRIYMNLRPADPLPYGFEQYSPDAFARAQADGGLILVDVYATWCPTCKAQQEVLDDLLTDPRYGGMRGFRVDFDADEGFLRRYRVSTQSTIIMFRGGRELSRSAGVTDERRIRAQLDVAVGDASDS